MVVAMESQVPSWVNRDNVNIVTHDQIIDPEELPTFNAMTIYKYFNLISGLSDKYIYSNDDWYALNRIDICKCFNDDGMPMTSHETLRILRKNTVQEKLDHIKTQKYACICNNTYKKFLDVCKKAGITQKLPYDIDDSCIPMFAHGYLPCDKNEMEQREKDLFQLRKVRFKKGRDFKDIDYVVLNHELNILRTPKDAGITTAIMLKSFVPQDRFVGSDQDKFNAFANQTAGDKDMICINDTPFSTRDIVANWLDSRFPDKCKYENDL